MQKHRSSVIPQIILGCKPQPMPTKRVLIPTEKSRSGSAHKKRRRSTERRDSPEPLDRSGSRCPTSTPGRQMSVQNGSSNAPALTILPLLPGTFLSKHRGGSVSARAAPLPAGSARSAAAPGPVCRGRRARAGTERALLAFLMWDSQRHRGAFTAHRPSLDGRKEAAAASSATELPRTGLAAAPAHTSTARVPRHVHPPPGPVLTSAAAITHMPCPPGSRPASRAWLCPEPGRNTSSGRCPSAARAGADTGLSGLFLPSWVLAIFAILCSANDAETEVARPRRFRHTGPPEPAARRRGRRPAGRGPGHAHRLMDGTPSQWPCGERRGTRWARPAVRELPVRAGEMEAPNMGPVPENFLPTAVEGWPHGNLGAQFSLLKCLTCVSSGQGNWLSANRRIARYQKKAAIYLLLQDGG